MILTNAKIAKQVQERLLGMARRLADLCWVWTPYNIDTLSSTFDYYREALSGERGEAAGHMAARRLQTQLIGELEAAQPEFWATELGRCLAWWTGGPEHAVPRPVVAELLQCSRQNVHQLLETGALKPAPGETGRVANVSPDSVRAEMRRRWPQAMGA